MIGIEAIASYIPPDKVSNLDRAAAFEKPESFITDKIGFQNVTRKSPEQETSDLCVEAFTALEKKTGLDKSNVDCLIVCTQNPDGYGLPHTAGVVHAKLGLESQVAAFDISLGCSGYVYGLSVIESFMERNGLKCGLLFTADPYSKVLDVKDGNTELLFGDAATVTLVSDQPRLVSMKGLFASDGTMRHSIQVDPVSEKLSMLGSNVFKFTMTAVPKQIQECLKINELTVDDIDWVLLHQGSKFIVDNMTRALRLPPEKVPFAAKDTGNTVSSTIPLMLEPLDWDSLSHILISGFGVGLSWATSILRSTNTD